MVRSIVKVFVLIAALHCIGPQTFATEAAAVRLSTFRCDVTPPLDGRSFGGWAQPLTKLEDRLWAKGIVLDDGRGRYVVCAMDWCELCNSTHRLFCRQNRRRRRNRRLPSGHPVPPPAYGAGGRRRRGAARPPGDRRSPATRTSKRSKS